MRLFCALFVLALAAGCAGTKFHADQLTSVGVIRLAEPDAADHDFKFYIRSMRDYGSGFDTTVESDRVLLIEGYLRGACQRVHVVAEQFLATGGALAAGSPAGSFVTRVRCIK
jgi:hypothetical protein